MNNDKLLYGAVGLILGIILTWVFAVSAVNGNNFGVMRMMGIGYNNTAGMMNQNFYSNMHGAMEAMMSNLLNKNGDEFDQAFINEMIELHQSGVYMSNLALSNAKHQEIKDLSKSIIEEQTKEINQMRAWQQAWYK